MLQIAPSGYRRHAARQRTPALRCARAKRDDILIMDTGIAETIDFQPRRIEQLFAAGVIFITGFVAARP